LAPNGNTNLALKDVVNALQFLKNNVAAFGGSPNKITVAGQSSGATMIRALLGVPSASSLFKSAILQSDPMVSLSATYGKAAPHPLLELRFLEARKPSEPLGCLHGLGWVQLGLLPRFTSPR
jgi:carboxylesterase type B